MRIPDFKGKISLWRDLQIRFMSSEWLWPSCLLEILILWNSNLSYSVLRTWKVEYSTLLFIHMIKIIVSHRYITSIIPFTQLYLPFIRVESFIFFILVAPNLIKIRNLGNFIFFCFKKTFWFSLSVTKKPF